MTDVYLHVSIDGLWEENADEEGLKSEDQIEEDIVGALKRDFEGQEYDTTLEYDVDVTIEDEDNE